MTTFNKASQKSEAGTARAAVPMMAPAGAGEGSFASSFTSVVAKVAKPLFEQFAHDAKARGYPAIVTEGVDGDKNPYISISFIPEHGAKLGADDCVFQLKGTLADNGVEYTSCHEHRAGKKGARTIKADLQSINQEFLEEELGEFLRAALEARES